jgi:hypothetical protein
MGGAPNDEAVKQIHHLAAALQAPQITEAATQLADQARHAGWTHEDYPAAVLEREVSARNASEPEIRVRAAGFSARKTLEDLDWGVQPAVRPQIGPLAFGGFLTEARNIVLLGPPGTGKTHLATGLGILAARHGHRRCSRPPRTGSPASPTPTGKIGCRRNSPGPTLRADHRRRSRLSPVRARRREPVLPTRLIPLRNLARRAAALNGLMNECEVRASSCSFRNDQLARPCQRLRPCDLRCVAGSEISHVICTSPLSSREGTPRHAAARRRTAIAVGARLRRRRDTRRSRVAGARESCLMHLVSTTV